ncbi:hypothetical protein ACFL1A_02355 [Patescibacteria group bacterium]
MNKKMLNIVTGFAIFVIGIAFFSKTYFNTLEIKENTASVLGARNYSTNVFKRMHTFSQEEKDMFMNKSDYSRFGAQKKEMLMQRLEENREQRQQMIMSWKDGKASKIDELAGYIGLTIEQLRERKKNGETMEDILTSQGHSQEEIEAFMMTQGEERLNKLVEEGKITQERAESMLQKFNRLMGLMMMRWFGGSK